MKFKRILIISLFCGFSYGQTEVLTFDIETKNTRSKKTTYSLINSKINDLAFLILDRKIIHAHLFDSNFNQLSSFRFDAPKKKFFDPLGYTVTNRTYNLLYASSDFLKFIAIDVDFDTKKADLYNLDFTLENNELFIDTVIHNNELFFLTNKDDSIIIRKLHHGKHLKIEKTIQIKQPERKGFVLKSNTDFLWFFKRQVKESLTTKIDHRIPTSIEQASSSSKLFKYGNSLVFTVEIEHQGTIVYRIDFKTLNVSQRFYEYAEGKIDDFKKYNSFVYDDKIFQVASSQKEMNFSIKDLDNNLLKEFYLTKDKLIEFKNGPIVQEGHTALPFQNIRKLEATSKFLRKISSSDIGVSVIKVNDCYEITIGGFKQISNNSGGSFLVPTAGFGTGTAFSAPAFNPTFLAYTSYSLTRATFFNAVLDNYFEPLEKEFENELNDRIDTYISDYKAITGEDVFFHNNIPYYSFFNLQDKTFHLIQF